MMFVALLLRPWLQMMGDYNVKAAILADDIIIVAKGATMVRTFVNALNATHEYLHSIGPKVAPDKSYNFASTHAARGALARVILERPRHYY